MNDIKNVTILGDGGWGTTLAILLSKKGVCVTLWSVSKKYAKYLEIHRTNPKFLKGIKIPRTIFITSDIKQALICADLVIIAVPSIYIRLVLRKIKGIADLRKKIFLSVVKGIEPKTLKRMSEVIEEELGQVHVTCLSGPTIAIEVAKNQPTTAVIAGKIEKDLILLQNLLSGPRFRLYRNTDLIGVELGGSLKNIIAIACGISDGLGFGTNAKAAIISRGLAEIKRLALALGAKAETFNGISGVGDLVTTCISKFSRNRFVGVQLAKGKTIKNILNSMQMVAEGVTTVKSAYELSLEKKIEMPITKEIYNVIYRKKSAHIAVDDLMLRRMKAE
jgi:glycerol-3-phosphate dehydrogenase (NAD(P)+)